MGGIGVCFESRKGSDGLYVVSLRHGGPTAATGRIRPGDELCLVDGKHVAGRSMRVVPRPNTTAAAAAAAAAALGARDCGAGAAGARGAADRPGGE